MHDLVKRGADDRGGNFVCPRCVKPGLRERVFGECSVLQCGLCEGIWVPRGQAGKLQESFPAVGSLDRAALARVREAAALRNMNDGVRYLACPMCQERMDRRQFSFGSGIVIDRCIPHGVWFDGGELELASTYFAVGGPRELALRQARSKTDPRKVPGRPAARTPGADGAPVDPTLNALLELLTWLS